MTVELSAMGKAISEGKCQRSVPLLLAILPGGHHRLARDSPAARPSGKRLV